MKNTKSFSSEQDSLAQSRLKKYHRKKFNNEPIQANQVPIIIENSQEDGGAQREKLNHTEEKSVALSSTATTVKRGLIIGL